MMHEFSGSAMFSRRCLLRRTGAAAAMAVSGGTGVRSWAWEVDQRAVEGKKLIQRMDNPYNGEPALAELVKAWITPTEYFYVRSHAPVPELDRSFTLTVEGLVAKPLRLSLDQLNEQFPQRQVTATLTCAGNRREEHSRVEKVSGVQWGAGAIGNARWSGVPLSQVLKQAGVKPEAKHVWFEGVDQIERQGGTIPFGGSIPLKKALGDTRAMPGALIATGMNGRPLTPAHGYPLRTVVPGYIGARSVKWLGRIVVSDRPSPNHYLAGAYKLVTENEPARWQAAAPIYQFPINAVIAVPAAGATLKAGRVKVSGYALPPGAAGRTIKRVELSADGGKSWTSASFSSDAHEYCWRLWQAEISVSRATSQLIVRAVDSSGKRQPEMVPWNLKGYLFNAWHRTPVKVEA